jgi:hypothetical protein
MRDRARFAHNAECVEICHRDGDISCKLKQAASMIDTIEAA